MSQLAEQEGLAKEDPEKRVMEQTLLKVLVREQIPAMLVQPLTAIFLLVAAHHESAVNAILVMKTLPKTPRMNLLLPGTGLLLLELTHRDLDVDVVVVVARDEEKEDVAKEDVLREAVLKEDVLREAALKEDVLREAVLKEEVDVPRVDVPTPEPVALALALTAPTLTLPPKRPTQPKTPMLLLAKRSED